MPFRDDSKVRVVCAVVCCAPSMAKPAPAASTNLVNDDMKKEGKLTGVTEEAITIEYTEGKGKKAVINKDEIPFADIKQTKVQVKF